MPKKINMRKADILSRIRNKKPLNNFEDYIIKAMEKLNLSPFQICDLIRISENYGIKQKLKKYKND